MEEKAPPARQNRWLIPVALAIALPICCALAVCLAAAVILVGSSLQQVGGPSRPSSQEPAAAVELDRQPPSQAERETARSLRRTELPTRDLVELAQRLRGVPESELQPVPTRRPAPELGDLRSFWLHDSEADSYFTATAKLEFSTTHAYWWVEEGYDVASDDLARSARNFENRTYPTSRRYFGSEWTPGIDGDPHIYIVLANVPGVGGYFSGPDEYPAAVAPHSNQHEMFYINLDDADPGDSYFDGVLAHEFQHMIHWAVDRDEDTWVSEGLSELASRLNGYDVGGSDYVFSQQPDTQLTTWSELEDSGPHYGASYLFLSYFLERYGDSAIPRLVAEPANGVAGFEVLLTELDSVHPSFDDFFADWVVANYLDSTDPPSARHGYSDLDLSQPALAGHHRRYPVRQAATVHQYAADYVVLEGDSTVTFEFTGSLRVPLLGNIAHSGQYQWWSNRGDEGDATLTRGFDLTGLDEATLQAWLWYDLEDEYDYAYVEVSADGGQTWHLLASQHTTTADPTGSSYGPGLTGHSGGGETSVWTQQSFDLTPFAGAPILIRFEVITDEAVNRPGLAVDDISIPELGYLYDAEAGDDGWQAGGFLRVTDHIPQDFVVQVISQGRGNRAERVALDPGQHGQVTIEDLGDGVDRAVVVISGVAPVTTEPAVYSYRVAGE